MRTNGHTGAPHYLWGKGKGGVSTFLRPLFSARTYMGCQEGLARRLTGYFRRILVARSGVGYCFPRFRVRCFEEGWIQAKKEVL